MNDQKLDEEWILLIQEAIQLGLDIDEIKAFLNNYSNAGSYQQNEENIR